MRPVPYNPVMLDRLVLATALTSCFAAACSSRAGSHQVARTSNMDELPELQPLWNYDDPAATEATFRALLPRAEAGADRGAHAELLTQIARTQSLQRQLDAAHDTLDAADAMIEPGMAAARTRSLLERGRTYNSAGERDRAAPLFLEAWEVSRRAELDGLAVDAAHMVAIVETPEAALEWNRTALRLAERSADPDARRWRGSLHNNMGWTHHGEERYDAAMQHFDAALEARLEAGDPDAIRIARWCRARCLRSLGRTEEALAIQRQLETPEANGYVFEEIGECLLMLGRPDDARAYFRKAHEMLAGDPWLAEHEPARLERLRELGAPGAPGAP